MSRKVVIYVADLTSAVITFSTHDCGTPKVAVPSQSPGYALQAEFTADEPGDYSATVAAGAAPLVAVLSIPDDPQGEVLIHAPTGIHVEVGPDI